MKTAVYNVPRELVDSIQARQIELNGLKSMWAFALSNKEYAIPQEKITLLERDIIEKNAEYELLKRKVEDIFINEYNNDISWNLDFDSAIVTVNIND